MQFADQKQLLCLPRNEVQPNALLTPHNHLPNLLWDHTWKAQSKALKKQLDAATLELALLRDISQHLLDCDQQSDVLHLLLDSLNKLVPFHHAALAHLDNNAFSILAYHGNASQHVLIGQRLFLDDNLLSQEPILVSDTRLISASLQPDQHLITRQAQKLFGRVASLIAVPLTFRTTTIGWLLLAQPQPGHFSPHHTDLVTSFANYLALLLGYQHLYRHQRHQATLKERHRLAQQLHDNIAQSLGCLNLHLCELQSLLANGHLTQAQTTLNDLKQFVAETYSDVRQEISHLRGKPVSAPGFWETLRQDIAKYKKFYRLNVQLVIEADCARLEFPSKTGQELIHLIQEALINVRKHAGVDRAVIRFSQKDGRHVIVIEDKGRGFDLEQMTPAGFGLEIMQERATNIGGSVEINSTSGGGTQVVICL